MDKDAEDFLNLFARTCPDRPLSTPSTGSHKAAKNGRVYIFPAGMNTGDVGGGVLLLFGRSPYVNKKACDKWEIPNDISDHLARCLTASQETSTDGN